LSRRLRISVIVLGLAASAALATHTLTRRPAAAIADTIVLEGPSSPLRFVAIGDTGKGNETQYKVAGAMKTACETAGGCSFALLLGDNVYPSGVTSPADPQLAEKVEKPYVDLPFPFFVVLGNHDYGLSWEFWKARAELDFTKSHPKFRMPDRHYSFRQGPATFIAIDTNALFWGVTDDERAAFRATRAKAQTPWKIAFGHHPYVSNGQHGNAGSYDGLPFGWIPAAGGALEDFFEDELCGQIDLYFAGHDHNLQDLGNHCGTEFVVSGAGASTTRLKGGNKVEFQASTPGFVLVEAEEKELRLQFIDENGATLHSRRLAHR
jgi:hypothetical protein